VPVRSLNFSGQWWFGLRSGILTRHPVLVSVDVPDTLSYSSEVGRKALHLLALVIPFGMWALGAPQALYVVGTGAVVAVAADLTRAYSRPFNDWIRRVFGPLMRDEELPAVGERVTFNGATSVLVGAALLALIFPLRVAIPVLTMSMLADAAAALVGRRLGRHPWGSLSATVEGSLAFVATGLGVILWFPSVALGPAVAAVLVAAVVEALPAPVNDNIRVPLTAAAIVVAGEVLFFGQPLHLFTSLPS
jgi:dolichol kinase